MKKRVTFSRSTWRWLKLLTLSWLPLASQAQQGALAADPTIARAGSSPARPQMQAASASTPAARTTGTWTTMAAMSANRAEPGAAATNGKIYVWGGYPTSRSSPVATAEVYTIATNTWATMTSLPSAFCGPATAVGIDGNLYSFGGYNGTGYISTSYKYDVTAGTWTSIAAMPVARWEARALTAPDGRIFVFGGWNAFATSQVGAEVQIYTPATNSWSTGAAMPAALFGSGAGIDGAGLMHIYGGIDSNQTPTTTHIVYNITTNAWTTATATPTVARAYTTGTTGADGNLYMFGGANSIGVTTATTYSQVDYYTPSTATWTSGPALPTTLSEAASVVSGNYQYVVGGIATASSSQNTLYRLDVVAPTITTGALAATAYCAGSALTVPFTISGTFTAGNIFRAQLSSAGGSFATPTIIGTLTSTASGSIAATLPAGTTGTGFRVRVVSSTPAITGTDNGTNITITAPPVATFSYGTAASFCTTQATAQAVVLATGATAGTFTVAPATGLTLAANGSITPSTSTPGTYTVTNTVAASGGCAAVTATSTITITAPQTAGFTYGTASSFCTTQATTQAVVLSAGATAGTFTSTTGLILNAATGTITPATSTPGTYTVTNTVAASGGCAAVTATSTITITAPQTGTFTYPAPSASGAYCAGSTTVLTPTLAAGSAAGTFTLTAGTSTGATINASTGALNLSAASAGTFTVTNTVAAVGACAATTASQAITVLPLPTAPTLTTSGSPATGITLTATPLITGYTYLFYRNGVLVPGTTGNTYLVNSGTTNGAYTVVAVSIGGCQSPASAAVAVTVMAAATAQTTRASLVLYPNPAGHTATLSGAEAKVSVQVYDALGSLVLTTQADATGTAVLVLPATMPSGLYLVRTGIGPTLRLTVE